MTGNKCYVSIALFQHLDTMASFPLMFSVNLYLQVQPRQNYARASLSFVKFLVLVGKILTGVLALADNYSNKYSLRKTFMVHTFYRYMCRQMGPLIRYSQHIRYFTKGLKTSIACGLPAWGTKPGGPNGRNQRKSNNDLVKEEE